MKERTERKARRQKRTRLNLRQSALKKGVCRLVVFRSNFHIYAQIIDDAVGKTLVSSSTLRSDLKKAMKKSWTIEASEIVGKDLARQAKTAGVSQVIFDRGPYLYHGRVKALAESARSGGLKF